jgi:hypothetical protein
MRPFLNLLNIATESGRYTAAGIQIQGRCLDASEPARAPPESAERRSLSHHRRIRSDIIAVIGETIGPPSEAGITRTGELPE